MRKEMEVRFLQSNEIPAASALAAEVYRAFVVPFTMAPYEAEQFWRYADANHLRKEAACGRLFLWGIFENGAMCAVGAMQNVGHITMLYVRQPYQRRGFATLLLNTMRDFAFFRLHTGRVTACVFPKHNLPFFGRRGFCRIPGIPEQGAYIPLECRQVMLSYPNRAGYMPYGNSGVVYAQYPCEQIKKKRTEVVYPTKKVRIKTILLLAAVTLALCFMVGIGYSVYHIAADGLLCIM